MYLIDIIAGARPNFMKVASIIKAIEKNSYSGGCFKYRLIHTGQHYDSKMSGNFFKELDIPEPHVNLGIGSGTQAEQTAGVMIGYECVLNEQKSNICLVVGDVNSTMACAIVAQKMRVPVAHVEAGIRSRDWAMPEEINRIVTDSITNWFFTTSKQASANLRNTGVEEERIYFVGNTMIDTLKANFDQLCPPVVWKEESLEPKKYFVLTLHRPSNVDEREKLLVILNAISKGIRGRKVIFPVHPRTAIMFNELDNQWPGIVCAEPMGYLEFNYLVKNCKAVITDSGGVTEESTVMGIPCLTLRDSTERPETVTVGTNELVGTDPKGIKLALNKLFVGRWKKGAIPEKWDGKTGLRIVAVLEKLLCN